MKADEIDCGNDALARGSRMRLSDFIRKEMEAMVAQWEAFD
jgi:hypothetical protein